MIFLIEYNRKLGTIVSIERFASEERSLANEARLDLEIALNKRGVVHEVALLEAKDEAAVRRTHRRYFESIESLLKPRMA